MVVMIGFVRWPVDAGALLGAPHPNFPGIFCTEIEVGGLFLPSVNGLLVDATLTFRGEG